MWRGLFRLFIFIIKVTNIIWHYHFLLEVRHFKMDLILFHKLIHNYVGIDKNNSYLIKRTITSGDEYKIHQQKATNIIRHNSFFIKVPRQYSQLPIGLKKHTKKIKKNFSK